MAKTLSSDFSVDGNVAVYKLTDEVSKESQSFTLDLSALMAKPAEAFRALANGVRIRMREATGGKTFEDAATLLSDFAAAINAGNYPTRQREAGETRSSPFIIALARVFYSGDTAAAQAAYDEAVVDAAAAASVDLEAEDDASVKAASKLKRDLRAQMASNKRVAAELEALKLEAAELAIKRQRERAAAAAKAAEVEDA